MSVELLEKALKKKALKLTRRNLELLSCLVLESLQESTWNSEISIEDNVDKVLKRTIESLFYSHLDFKNADTFEVVQNA